MAAVGKLICAFVIFIAWTKISYTEASGVISDEQCKVFTLTSNGRSSDKKTILDKLGQPAVIVKVKVLYQFSDVPCKERSTYVTSTSSVTAKRGCSAEFKVCYRSKEDVDENVDVYVPPGCELVRLLSRLNRKVKKVLTRTVTSMNVGTQFKEGVTCQKNQNFGFRGREVYAELACRADFIVCFADYERYSTPDYSNCQTVDLSSSDYYDDRKKIVDEYGQPVEIVSMKLKKYLSNYGQCEEWVTYLFKDSHVIAKNGCSAKFKVCYKQKYGTNEQSTYWDNYYPESDTTTCQDLELESWTQTEPDWKKVEKSPGKPGYVVSIELVGENSARACVPGKTYYSKGFKIYATDGCQGTFRVCCI